MATIKQYTKKDGSKLWQFQTYLGINQATGKPVKTTRRGFNTKKEAQLELNRLLVEFETNGLEKEHNETFQEVYDLWFDNYRKTVKESTYLTTERHLKRHALPLLGKSKVAKIDVKTAQKAVNKWASDLATYRVILQYCSKIMDYAINLEIIASNPFTRIIRPNVNHDKNENKLKYYNANEVQKVMSFLENRAEDSLSSPLLKQYFAYYDLALYRLLAFSGIRGGEASALDWSDIDFTEKTISISKTLSEVKNGFKVSTPKTKSSNRTISLDDKTILTLKKWQLKQREFHFTNGINSNNMIFVNYNCDLMNRTDLYQRSRRLAEAVELPNIGTHGWRHSHASMLFEAGITMKEAQERLGHSSITQTMDTYTHLTEKTKKETVQKLVKFANF